MSKLEDAVAYAEANRKANLEGFKEVLAIPSISTLSEHEGDVAQMAEWLAATLRGLNMDNVEIIPTDGHPVVYGESLNAPGKPTILVYGHYDVQPADPLEEWETPPFEPTVRGENVYARGASDMKGQWFGQLKATEALVQQGELGFNIKYMLEGEEEIGSPHLAEFIDAHRDKLACDFVLNCDSGVQAPDIPGIIYALRGLAYFELVIQGAKKDLHSGLFGGTVPNPAHVLAELIAGMHDEKGRVTLPGFYDNVREITAEEEELMKQIPYSDAGWLELSGAKALHGEEGYSTLARVGARPTLDVNGMLSGFTGQGSKTVLPARAMAKISMRLVPDQRPEDARGQLEAYLKARCPEYVSWSLHEHAHGPGAVMDLHSEAMESAKAALRTVFGKEPIFKREGGSIPVVALLKEKLGVDTVMLGFSLPDDGIHGPNEKQHLPTFYKGIKTYIHFMAGLAG